MSNSETAVITAAATALIILLAFILRSNGKSDGIREVRVEAVEHGYATFTTEGLASTNKFTWIKKDD